MFARKLIGLDIGTTSVKAAVIDTNGAIHARFSESYQSSRTGTNLVEQNPDDWLNLLNKALNSFIDHKIVGIGICSQVNTHVFLGADGRPLFPAITWQDIRAKNEAQDLNSQVSDEKKIKWWGSPMPIDASHALSRMSWMKKWRGEIWHKTRKVMLPKDYCILKLTGTASTDPLSNIGLVDNKFNYIPELFDLVPGARQLMAPIIGVSDIAGYVTDGPFLGTPIISGTMDAWSGILGAGGAERNSSIYLSGTSEIMGISSSKIIPTPGAIVFPEVEEIRLHAAPTQHGGDAKLWFSSVFDLEMNQIAEMVSRKKRSNATPLFLPQLNGERSPHWDPTLRGAFLGVSRQTERVDFARAVYEGVAFAAKQAFEVTKKSSDVSSDVVYCGGGGFRSNEWNQIRSNVLGLPLKIIKSTEPGVMGAVTIAAKGVGIFQNLEKASKQLVQFDEQCNPDPKHTEQLLKIFEIYSDAISQTAAIGRRLNSLET
jgi:xylulokinase